MNELAKLAIDAHGGLDCWKRFSTLSVHGIEISGGTPASHYVSDFREFSGIVFPTKRRIFPRQPDGHYAPEPLVVSIDLDSFVLS